MMANKHLTLPEVNAHFGPKGYEFTSLTEDKSGFINKTIFLEEKGGKSYVLRLCSNMEQFRERKTRNEVTVFKFLERFPNLPAPKVQDFDTSRSNAFGCEYILMTRLPGHQLSEEMKKLDDVQVKKVMGQLIDFMRPVWECRFDAMGPLKEDFTPGPFILMEGKGPFKKKSEIFEALIKSIFDGNPGGFSAENKDVIMKLVEKLMEQGLPDPAFICFTHSDLKFDNILAKDGQITGFVDFEWSAASAFEMEIFNTDFYRLEQYRASFLEILNEKMGFDVKAIMDQNWEGNVTFLGTLVLGWHTMWGLTKDAPFVQQWVGELQKLLSLYGIFDGKLLK